MKRRKGLKLTWRSSLLQSEPRPVVNLNGRAYFGAINVLFVSLIRDRHWFHFAEMIIAALSMSTRGSVIKTQPS